MRLILAELRGWQGLEQRGQGRGLLGDRCRRAQGRLGGGGGSQWINATKAMRL